RDRLAGPAASGARGGALGPLLGGSLCSWVRRCSVDRARRPSLRRRRRLGETRLPSSPRRPPPPHRLAEPGPAAWPLDPFPRGREEMKIRRGGVTNCGRRLGGRQEVASFGSCLAVHVFKRRERSTT